MVDPIQPGDVLVVRSEHSFVGRLIRFGAALRDQPDTWNHVAIATHVDGSGAFWGIEGRPGGVGWVALASYLDDRWTIDNAAQPKTERQRALIVDTARGLLGTPYDWQGIVADAMAAIDAPRLWRMRFDALPPAHVVCSSLASWVYEHVGLTCPRTADRVTTPADWASFIMQREWRQAVG